MYPFEPVRESLNGSLRWVESSAVQKDNGLSLSFYTAIVSLLIFVCYLVALSRYHWTHWSKKDGQLPPAYPSLIPVVGNLLPFLWDNEGFFRRVTAYKGTWTAARVSVLGQSVYLFQDRESIQNMWKSTSLGSPVNISMYVFKYFLGVPEKTLDVYRSDTSGPYRTPHPGSTVPPNKRVDYLSHQEFLRALSGSGLRPTLKRFRRSLKMQVDNLDLSDEWTELGDFGQMCRRIITAPMIESIFGPFLLRLNPGFVDDIYEYDANVPWLARGIPSFIMPQPHRVRKRLAAQLRKWHEYAESHFDESSIDEDGDGDPFWGSKFTRNRRKMFKEAGDHDEDAVVALDLGLCFGLVANTSPATLLVAWHIFKDPSLLQRIRGELHDRLGTNSIHGANLQEILSIPLLQSVYAETLRLYTKIYIMVSSPHSDVPLGRWSLPKKSIALLNSSISHRDPDFWNTRDGLYPVDSFWADRFLTDPKDPASGPINPAVRAAPGHGKTPRTGGVDGSEEPFFSMDGLESSWFPYGGGFSICPGRHMAKAVIIFTCAVLVREFDIECLTDSLAPDSWRFGLGLLGPTNELRFRIRKRKAAT